MIPIPHAFAIQPNQETKIRKALNGAKGCRIQVKKGAPSNGQLLVTPAHLKRYRKASHGSVVNLPFKHNDLRHNHKGGFLPLLAAALAPVIGGVAGGLIEREIAGSGIRNWKGRGKPWWHGGKVPTKLYTIEKHGSGMFLNPWMGGPPTGGRVKNLYSMEKHGSGMFLNPWMGGIPPLR